MRSGLPLFIALSVLSAVATAGFGDPDLSGDMADDFGGDGGPGNAPPGIGGDDQILGGLDTLPPTTHVQSESDATHIFTGRVDAIYTHVIQHRKGTDFQDTNYLAEVSVTGVDSPAEQPGCNSGPAPGMTAVVRYWAVHRRPSDWNGPLGQTPLPVVGSTYKFFAIEDDYGMFDLVDPAGTRLVAAGKADPHEGHPSRPVPVEVTADHGGEL
jgi:hypothetical protein